MVSIELPLISVESHVLPCRFGWVIAIEPKQDLHSDVQVVVHGTEVQKPHVLRLLRPSSMMLTYDS